MRDEEQVRRHAEALHKALANEKPETKQAIMRATGKSYRAVTGWASLTTPHMPSERDRATLREILGNYDAPGDSVERAVKASELHEWRQSDVITTYKRHLHEQRKEVSG